MFSRPMPHDQFLSELGSEKVAASAGVKGYGS